jgi:hypothetical protein
LVWSILTAADFAKTETGEEAMPEVIDELIVNIPQAHIIVLFYESETKGKKQTKALIYSVKNINALDIVQPWEPVGTKNLSRLTTEQPVQEAEKKIISHINQYLNKLLD